MFLEVYPQVLGVSTLKACPKCSEVKQVDQFSRDATRTDGRCAYCKTCVREWQQENRSTLLARDKEYRTKNAERILARKRAHYAANREELTAQARKYREEHHDTVRFNERRRRAANPEKVKEQRRAQYAANADHYRAKQRKYHAEHPEVRKAYYENNKEKFREYQQQYRQTEQGKMFFRIRQQRRRFRKAAAGGVFSITDIEAIRVAQGNRCYLCGKKLKAYHIDHFIPLALGGTNDAGNLRLACPKCNLSKGAKHPHEMGLLL
jgi:5-methylcytosine-specific restriction endonuclease McrA